FTCAVVLGREHQHLAVELERALPLARMRRAHVGEAELERRELLGALRTEIDPALERFCELAPALASLEKTVERGVRLRLVVAPLREDRSVSVDRVGRVAEL